MVSGWKSGESQYPPGSHFPKLYKGLIRQQASLLTQLRTQNDGLNQYLHRINAVDSPDCAHCGVPETVDHYLLTCRRFTEQRARLRSKIRCKLTVANLIGSKPPAAHLFKFIEETERFPRSKSAPEMRNRCNGRSHLQDLLFDRPPPPARKPHPPSGRISYWDLTRYIHVNSSYRHPYSCTKELSSHASKALFRRCSLTHLT